MLTEREGSEEETPALGPKVDLRPVGLRGGGNAGS